MENNKVNEKYDLLNERYWLCNHPEYNVYCPFCGKEISENVFDECINDGSEIVNSGAHCEDCDVDIYTYKVIQN